MKEEHTVLNYSIHTSKGDCNAQDQACTTPHRYLLTSLISHEKFTFTTSPDCRNTGMKFCWLTVNFNATSKQLLKMRAYDDNSHY
jgi:hypothetical protein